MVENSITSFFEWTKIAKVYFAHVKSCDHTLEKLLYYPSTFGIYGQIFDGAKHVKDK